MTTIEQQAREAQKAAGFLAQPSDLSGCQHERSCAAFRINETTGYFDGQPCDCGANGRWGDLAIKRLRAQEKEIASLRKALAEAVGAMERYMKYHEEKFYADRSTKPTGLHPAIADAKRALSGEKIPPARELGLPEMCYTPNECAGRTSCPRPRACSS